MTNNSKNKIFIPNLLLLIIGLAVILFSVYNIVSLTLIKSDKASVLDTHENEYYVIGKDPTDLQVEVFLALSEKLLAENRDNQAIADDVAKSFVIDFFNWNNKDAAYEIGGLQYMYDPLTFNKIAHYEYYQKIDVFNNTYGKEKLPEVKVVNSTTNKTDNYIIDDKSFEAYYSKVKFSYEDSANLDIYKFVDEVDLILINDDGKLVIVEVMMVDEVDLYE